MISRPLSKHGLKALSRSLLAGAVLTATAAGSTGVAPSNGDPIVVAASERLLSHLHEVRPDLGRIEAIAIGAPAVPSLQGVSAFVPANAIHGSVLAARTCVWVQLRRAGHSLGSVPLWFAVKAYRPVLVAQRSRAARDPVNAADFVVEERDVASAGAIPFEVGADMTRMRARRAISSGHVVLQGDLEEMPQIMRGQEVAVQVRYGTVAIETTAMAVREARLGETVTLQNPTSHATYVAHVVGQGKASVAE